MKCLPLLLKLKCHQNCTQCADPKNNIIKWATELIIRKSLQPQLHSAHAIYISIMKEKNGTYVKTTGSSSNIIQAIKKH